MNAIPEHSTLTPIPPDWGAIYAEVNAWRGECLHHFSAVEQAVTKTLLAMDEAKADGANIRLRHLIGQRFEDLADAIEPSGPFATVGKPASEVLANYRNQHEAFRAQLCHGHITVCLARDGQWLLILQTLSIRERQANRETVAIEQSIALPLLEELKRDGQRLAAVLGQVRNAIDLAQSTK